MITTFDEFPLSTYDFWGRPYWPQTISAATMSATKKIGHRQLASARALLQYVIIIAWVRSDNKMLPSVKFAEDRVLTFLNSL